MRIAKRPQTSPFALDGGAAMVVTATERAADLRQRRVFISAVPEGDPDSPGSITQRPDMTSLGVGKAAARAFRMAGDTHPDIDVVWIYDCFTYAVIRQLEDMGFCAKGEGGPFVQNGGLKLGGALPTNTHGGTAVAGACVGTQPCGRLPDQS